MSFDWNSDRVAELKILQADGKSAEQISRIMKVGSRSAVIGKLHRLNIKGFLKRGPTINDRRQPPHLSTTRPPSKPIVIRPTGRHSGPQVAPDSPAVDLPSEPSDYATLLVEAREDQCRYPLGEPSHNMLVCGAPGYPYCEHHRAICWTPTDRRRRAA